MQLIEHLNRAGHRLNRDPADGVGQRPVERKQCCLRPRVVIGEQRPNTSARAAARLMYLRHPSGEGAGAADDALGRDGLGERPLDQAVVGDQRADQAAAGAAMSGSFVVPVISSTPGGSFVAGGGLGPQVELSPISLDLPPHGERTESEHGEQEQLLHACFPSGSVPAEIALHSPRPAGPGSLASQCSARPLHASLVPDWPSRFVDLAIRAKHQEPVKRLGKPAVVRHRQDGPE